jgi:hypothetical protein
MDPEQVQRLRAIWLVAFFIATGIALVGFGLITALLTAIACVGATVLAVSAFVLWLILGEAPIPLRILLIALFFGGLFIELGAIFRVVGAIR